MVVYGLASQAMSIIKSISSDILFVEPVDILTSDYLNDLDFMLMIETRSMVSDYWYFVCHKYHVITYLTCHKRHIGRCLWSSDTPICVQLCQQYSSVCILTLDG